MRLSPAMEQATVVLSARTGTSLIDARRLTAARLLRYLNWLNG